ncbi:MAG: hypothetical protein ABIP49_03895 [Lysobacterales bacterium]
MLAGCGGTKLLREPQPLHVAKPLIETADERLAVHLDWVTVRNGVGAWARNADWDEYHVRVRNLSGSPVELTDISVFDSLGTGLLSGADRKELVRNSRKSVRRYRDSGLKVKAGLGGAGLIVAGAATTLGVGTAYAVAVASTAGWGSAAGGMTAAGAGLVLAGPAVLGVGVVRAINNAKVNTRIQALRTQLPIDIEPQSERAIVIFFPLAPAPRKLQVDYRDADGAHRLDVDTKAALAGLHLYSNELSSRSRVR